MIRAGYKDDIEIKTNNNINIEFDGTHNIINNKIQISKFDAEANLKHKVIIFKKITRMTKSIKEMSGFLFAHGGILSASYKNSIDFGTMLFTKGGNMFYSFFSIAEGETEEEASNLATMNIGMLEASYKASYNQTEIENLSQDEVEHVYSLMREENIYIGMLTGIPMPKHAKSIVGQQQSRTGFNDLKKDEIGEQMEEFVKGVGSKDYCLLNIIRPCPYEYAKNLSWQISELEAEVEKESTFTQNFGASIGLPLGLNSGVSDGVSDGYNYGTNNSWGENFGGSEGASYGLSNSIGHGYSWGDSWGMSIGSSENVGWNKNEGMNWNMGVNEGWNTNQGYNYGTNEGVGFNRGVGESFGNSYNEGTSQGFSQGLSTGYSLGSSWNQGISDGYSLGWSRNDGFSIGGSEGSSINDGVSFGGSWNAGKSFNLGESSGLSLGASNGWNLGGNLSGGHNFGGNIGDNSGSTTGFQIGLNNTGSSGVNSGLSWGENYGWGESWGGNFGKNIGYNEGLNRGEGINFGGGFNEGANVGSGKNFGMNYGENIGYGANVGTNTGRNFGMGENFGYNAGKNYGENFGSNWGYGENWGKNWNEGSSYNKGSNEGWNTGSGYNLGYNQGVGYNQGEGWNYGYGTNQGQNYGKNYGGNYNVNQSYNLGFNEGTNWGKNTGGGSNQGWNFGTNHGTNQGMSYGLSPSLSWGRTYTYKNYTLIQIKELLDAYRMKIFTGLREGNFIVSTYFFTRDLETYGKGKQSLLTAIDGDVCIPTYVVDIVEGKKSKQVQIMNFELDFTPSSTNSLIRPLELSNILNKEDLSAITHVPRIELGGILTSADDIPPFTVKSEPKTASSIFLGYSIVPALGGVDKERRFYFEANKHVLSHTIISGTTGSGKSELARRYVAEIARKKVEDPELAKLKKESEWVASGIIIDWKRDWRSILNILPEGRGEFFELGGTLRPYHTNLLAVPRGVKSIEHFSGMAEGFCLANGLGSKANTQIVQKFMEYCSGSVNDKVNEYIKKIRVDLQIDSPSQGYAPSQNKPSSKVALEQWLTALEEIKEANLENAYVDEKTGERIINPEEIIQKNSKKITLAHFYYIFEVERNYEKMEKDLIEAYERLTIRFKLFTDGMLRDIFCYNYSDATEVGDLLENDKIIVLEGSGIQSQLELKKFIIYTLSNDIYAYCANKYSKGGTLSNLKFIIFEEALDIIPSESGTANKQVLDVPQTVYDRIWTQGRGYNLRGVAIVQYVGHLSHAIKSSSPTSFFMKTELKEDMEYIAAKLGKSHQYSQEDKGFEKFLPKMPVGWAIFSNNAKIRKWGDGEPTLICAEMVELTQLTDNDLKDMVYSEKLLKNNYS